MELKKFSEIMSHLVKASTLVQQEVPENTLERFAWDLNITQAAQWLRNYRERGNPKDYIMSQEAAKKTLKLQESSEMKANIIKEVEARDAKFEQ